jgi:hypothetical protein
LVKKDYRLVNIFKYKQTIIKMGLLKDFINKLKMKREAEAELETNLNIQKRVLNKQKSADEREYESYIEEMKKRKLRSQLQKLRKQKAAECWRANSFAGNKYLFKEKVNLGRYY